MIKKFFIPAGWNSIICFGLMLSLFSCNKKFDEPPLNADPEITVNMTIQELKARYTAAGVFQSISDDKVIAGVVIADDRSGNFYKQVVIQDGTGGIPILLDGNNVYSMYPVGRKLFIKLKGLMLGDYGGTIQLGLDSTRSDDGKYLNVGRIPQAQFDQFILKGSFGNVITPKIVKPSDFTKAINDPLLSTLVQINNAEFRDADLAKTYADSTQAQTAVNFTIKTCDNQSIILRNSSFARFAGLKVAQGNGPLVGISSIFNSALQIFVRDTADVQFRGIRCSGQLPVAVTKSIADVLKYATGDSTIPAGISIEGVVVSATTNEAAGNYRLQDGSAGLQLRFASGSYPASAALGDKLSVYVGGYKLSVFSGGLQINGVETSKNIGSGVITPRMATIAEVLANKRLWESTVVTIKNITVAGSGTNYVIKDATGEIASFVRSTAGIVMPAAADSITGYVSVYQPAGGSETAQLNLRGPADIVGGTSGPPSGAFTAMFDFASVTTSSGASDPSPVPLVEGLAFNGFKAVGVGGATPNSSGGGRFSFNDWPLGATNGSDVFTGTPDLNKYYEVSLTPGTGKKLDINKLSFTFQRSSTGVRQAIVRTSMDGYSGNITAVIDPANTNLSIAPTYIFQITDAATTAQEGCTINFGTGFKGLTAALTIRFYGFNVESSGGTFSIDNVKMEGVIQ